MPPSNERKQSLETRQLRYDQQNEQLLPFLLARGLDERATERFRLGYVPPGSELDLPAWWGRMAIPYLTPTGIVQHRFRCLDPHHGKGQDAGSCPKFIGETGSTVTLYNAHATLRPSPVTFLTEGEPDVWAIETLLGRPAIGIPGAQSWKRYPFWARCFVGHHLIFPTDGDDAGDQLAAAVTASLPEVHHIRLPDGEDANSLLARDPDDFLRRVGL